MAKRAKNYQMAGFDSDSVTSNQRTPEVLEQAVKRLTHAPFFSDPWLLSASEAEKISNISSMELSKNTEIEAKASTAGINKTGTLWDSDQSLDTLRVLVENQKVNTIICLLKDIKETARFVNFQDIINANAQRLHKSYEELIAKLDHFEFDLGLLLKRLFEHAEAIQTCDLGLVLEYIMLMLNSILENRGIPNHLELRQEGLIFNYIFGVFSFIEQLNEGQIVQWAKSSRLGLVLVDILVNNFSIFPSVVQQKILESLGAIADCV
jgi:hypothetical protein